MKVKWGKLVEVMSLLPYSIIPCGYRKCEIQLLKFVKISTKNRKEEEDKKKKKMEKKKPFYYYENYINT